ncbi:agamous-like MADS-box protein AGL30 [Glycine soja]|uniref:agamous-like MADS-box protein AGL30 n=1 Tax=Glycine max TaxID=3847 RepID=UPI0003DE86D6|nr:agamous-like MADS-box protein AGL30 [Glycine max]XP_028225425.1 agamous-like MADS-box protein AGL30 [Glycine soja]|eukprot:XP_006573964.1 agamous-like MADS-box protein AGL30 [Glycine max]
MGRVKLKIKRMENTNGLLATYAKRKNRIMKKAAEYWTDLGTSNSVEQLGQMENSLKESLNQIRSHKENIQKQEFASLQCNNQFNEMHVPFRMDVQQHLQPLSWITNGDNQNLVLSEDSNLLLHEDIEGSTSYSFRSYANDHGSSTKTHISISKQENGILSDL